MNTSLFLILFFVTQISGEFICNVTNTPVNVSCEDITFQVTARGEIWETRCEVIKNFVPSQDESCPLTSVATECQWVVYDRRYKSISQNCRDLCPELALYGDLEVERLGAEHKTCIYQGSEYSCEDLRSCKTNIMPIIRGSKISPWVRIISAPRHHHFKRFQKISKKASCTRLDVEILLRSTYASIVIRSDGYGICNVGGIAYNFNKIGYGTRADGLSGISCSCNLEHYTPNVHYTSHVGSDLVLNPGPSGNAVMDEDDVATDLEESLDEMDSTLSIVIFILSALLGSILFILGAWGLFLFMAAANQRLLNGLKPKPEAANRNPEGYLLANTV